MKLVSCDTDSSDDECLMQLSKRLKNEHCKASKKYNINPRSSLCDRRPILCDICGCLLDNMLDALVHNASHIIIPLLRIEDSNSLEKDTSNSSHNSIHQNGVPSQNTNVVTNYNQYKAEINYEDSRIINSMLNVECQVKLEDAVVPVNDFNGFNDKEELPVLYNFIGDCKVNLGEPLIFDDIDDLKVTIEDDEDDIIVLKDTEMRSQDFNVGTSWEREKRMLETRVPLKTSYDDLKSDLFVDCDLCSVTLKTRFEAIRHRLVHLRMRIAQFSECMVCVTGKRVLHAPLPLCSDCGFTYDLRNMYSYTTALCKFCPKRFKSVLRLIDHVIVHDKLVNFKSDTVVRMCGICSTLECRNSNYIKSDKNGKYRFNYSHIGFVNGVHQVCDVCHETGISMNIFHKYRKYLIRSTASCIAKMYFEDDIKVKKGKRMTNAVRLKNIQDRIRKMNILGKY